MGEAATRRMTADEFLTWDDGTDQRYELVDGQIVAMAPPSDPHGTIVVNAAVETSRLIEGREPCRAIVEAGLRLDEHNHYKADVAVTCTEPRQAAYVEEPVLIVEVLSASTHRDDVAIKGKRYVELPSVQEMWLIDSRERWVQVWRRQADAWIVTMPLRGSDRFESGVLGDRVGLGALYRNTGL